MTAVVESRHVPSWELLRCLPDVADRLHSQLHELHHAPTPERVERLACELLGVHRYILTIRQALYREAVGPDA